MKNYLFIILALLYCQNLTGQDSNVLAKFGNENITAEEFKFRFELVPRAGGSADITTQKEQFLSTLIAEKLWAAEAKYLGMDNDKYMKNYLSIIEKLYVRDALFNEEVKSKATVNDIELREGLKKIDKELKINFLYSDSKEIIDSLFTLLHSGYDFYSLLNSRHESAEQIEPITVVYGQVDERKESILFSLEAGQFSEPVKENIGWVIYFLKSISPSRLTIKMDNSQKIKSVKEVIENRKEKILFENFIKGLLGDQTVNVDINLFRKLNMLIQKAAEKKCSEINCGSSGKIILYNPDFKFVKANLTKDELNSEFVKFNTDPVNLEYFIDDLAFNEFQVDSLENSLIKKKLNNYVRDFITLEMLSREGYKRNLNNGSEVKNAVKYWKNNYLSHLLKNTYTDSARVTDSEAYKYYLNSINDTSNFERIALDELVTNDLSIIETIINRLSEGIDFKQVARELSASKKGVVLNHKIEINSLNANPELKRAAEGLNIGDIGGPVQVGDGYSIFQVLEKSSGFKAVPDSFDSEKEGIKQHLFYEKMEKYLTERTVKLAEKYNLKVNEDLLRDIKTTEINALVYRHFGFGGRILAAPFLNMFYKWFDEYNNKLNEPL